MDMIRFLVEKGLSPTDTDNDNSTPLLWACQNGQLDAAKFFVEAGCDINIMDTSRSK